MTPADRVALLDIMGVKVCLTADRSHLDVSGPAKLVDAASASLRLHRAELIAFLHAEEPSVPPRTAVDTAVRLAGTQLHEVA